MAYRAYVVDATDLEPLSRDLSESDEAGSDRASPASPARSHIHSGPRCRLVHEGNMNVCRLNHTQTVINKIMNSKLLRRWESHYLVLDESAIRSTTPSGYMELSITYSGIEDINVISRWDSGQSFCIRITVNGGLFLFQAKNSYLRDQWLHSIQWKRCALKYDRILKNTERSDVLIKEIKNMIDLSLTTPIQDVSVCQFPLDLISELLHKNVNSISASAKEQIIVALAPLLENNYPTQEICGFFSKHCKDSPRSEIIVGLFTPVVQRILKHNTDFGKYPRMRTFIQDYIQAINAQNNGLLVVKNFIGSIHGIGSTCPHPRVLPNLVAVCLAAIYTSYEDRKTNAALSQRNSLRKSMQIQSANETLVTYLSILEFISTFHDWRPVMSSLLQPIPFPDEALAHDLFTKNIGSTLTNFLSDDRCEVHLSILGIRESKEGWFDLFCPGGIACNDEGELYHTMLGSLIRCCCNRKKFLLSKMKMINPWQLLALREKEAAIRALCGCLEYEVCCSEDLKMQIVTTLQSTPNGKKMYTELCERQIQLRELQQKGGPKTLALPPRSTDKDLAQLLGSGCFGNLETLTLAFTHVTNACAKDLIKLPSLRHLNLWSTQFGDSGLQLLSEHLHSLRSLNLCETPITDKGLSCLASFSKLHTLDLNSTGISAFAFEELKKSLTCLVKYDVRYTEAW